MHYYIWSRKDYAASTSYMTNGQDLAFRRLLDLYYDTESALPADPALLARKIRCPIDDVVEVLADKFSLDPDGYHNKRADQELARMQARAGQSRVNGRKGGRPPVPQEPSGNPVGSHQEPSGIPSGSHQEPDGNPSGTHQQPDGNRMATGWQPTLGVGLDSSTSTSSSQKKKTQKASNTSEPRHARTRTRADHTTDPAFMAFWNAYAKKVSVGQAYATWTKIRPSPELAAKITKQAAEAAATAKDPKYRPHASTWLNAQGWLDEYSEVPGWTMGDAHPDNHLTDEEWQDKARNLGRKTPIQPRSQQQIIYHPEINL